MPLDKVGLSPFNHPQDSTRDFGSYGNVGGGSCLLTHSRLDFQPQKAPSRAKNKLVFHPFGPCQAEAKYGELMSLQFGF